MAPPTVLPCPTPSTVGFAHRCPSQFHCNTFRERGRRQVPGCRRRAICRPRLPSARSLKAVTPRSLSTHSGQNRIFRLLPEESLPATWYDGGELLIPRSTFTCYSLHWYGASCGQTAKRMSKLSSTVSLKRFILRYQSICSWSPLVLILLTGI